MNNKYFVKSVDCNELCFLKQKHSSKFKENNSEILKLSKIELNKKKCLPC